MRHTRSASPRAGSPNGMPTTGACSMPSGLVRTSASSGSSTSAVRRAAARTATGRRFPRSSNTFPDDEEIMFYTTDTNAHGLPYDPLKALVAPRPIGWITSISAKGEINLAPYSYFNGASSRPPLVMFSSEGRKDSLTFIEETKEFVCNIAVFDLREAMNKTSAPFDRGVNEMVCAG